MPLYFFHVRHSPQDSDRDGIELSDINDAYDEATAATGELLREVHLRPGNDWSMSVSDEFETPLFEIRVAIATTAPGR